MIGLRDLQQQFAAHLLHGDDGIAAAVASRDRDDGDERLGIYAHAYGARLRDVLREEFSGLRALVGAMESEAAFTALMDGYIRAQPSRHPNIRWFGANMATWLASTPLAAAQPGYAAMAELDWALSTCFDAGAVDSIGVDALAALTPPQWPALALRPSPNLQRLALNWNVDAIREAVDNELAMPALQSLPVVVAVWRKDFGVRHRRLDADEAAALAAASDGQSFAELCGLLCEWHELDAVAARAVQLLQRWIAAGWISALAMDDGAAPR